MIYFSFEYSDLGLRLSIQKNSKLLMFVMFWTISEK